MVAPRTRADEPAQSTPAARPAARKPRAARPAKADATATPNGAAILNGAPGTHGTSASNGATPSNGAASAHRAVPKHDPRALGEQLIADVLKYDKDADVGRLRKAIDFAIEAHGEQ